MKRNWYAIAILVLLAAVLLGCKQYVSATAGSLRAQVQSAYAQTLTQQYPQAQQAFRQAAHSARQASKKLGLLVRRNALDRSESSSGLFYPKSADTFILQGFRGSFAITVKPCISLHAGLEKRLAGCR